MADPETDSPRVHLGRFELVYRLDVGGMAEIFLALERGAQGFERLVVIKQAIGVCEGLRELRNGERVAQCPAQRFVGGGATAGVTGASAIAGRCSAGISSMTLASRLRQ